MEYNHNDVPPFVDNSVYDEFNPMNYIENWRTPTLVTQGGSVKKYKIFVKNMCMKYSSWHTVRFVFFLWLQQKTKNSWVFYRENPTTSLTKQFWPIFFSFPLPICFFISFHSFFFFFLWFRIFAYPAIRALQLSLLCSGSEWIPGNPVGGCCLFFFSGIFSRSHTHIRAHTHTHTLYKKMQKSEDWGNLFFSSFSLCFKGLTKKKNVICFCCVTWFWRTILFLCLLLLLLSDFCYFLTKNMALASLKTVCIGTTKFSAGLTVTLATRREQAAPMTSTSGHAMPWPSVSRPHCLHCLGTRTRISFYKDERKEEEKKKCFFFLCWASPPS